MLHGTTAMPSVSKVPLAMAAPMLPMSCVRKASPARSVPLMPVSSCRTRSPASLVTRWTSQSFSLRMASSSETHRIAPLAPLNPTTRRFFMVLSFWRKRGMPGNPRMRPGAVPAEATGSCRGRILEAQMRNFPGSTSIKGALWKRSFWSKGTVQSKMALQPTPRAGMRAS